MRLSFYISALAVLGLAGCAGGTNHSDYHNHDTAGDHYRPRAGGRGDPAAAAGAR